MEKWCNVNDKQEVNIFLRWLHYLQDIINIINAPYTANYPQSICQVMPMGLLRPMRILIRYSHYCVIEVDCPINLRSLFGLLKKNGVGIPTPELLTEVSSFLCVLKDF